MKILGKILFITIGLLLLLGIVYGVFTWVYFACEPYSVYLGEGVSQQYSNVQIQVAIGRLISVSQTDAYDIMLYVDNSYECYRYVDVVDRYWNGLRALFTSFDMGLTESLTPVKSVLGAAVLEDIPPLMTGMVGGCIAATLFGYLTRKLKRLWIILISVLLSTYIALDLLFIHEPYSLSIVGVTTVDHLLVYRVSNKNQNVILYGLSLLPLSLSLAVLFLFPLSLYINIGLGSLLSPASEHQGSFLRAYGTAIYLLGIGLGSFLSASAWIITDKANRR